MLFQVRLNVPLAVIDLADGLQQQLLGRREKASRPVDSPTRLVSALWNFVVDRLDF